MPIWLIVLLSFVFIIAPIGSAIFICDQIKNHSPEGWQDYKNNVFNLGKPPKQNHE